MSHARLLAEHKSERGSRLVRGFSSEGQRVGERDPKGSSSESSRESERAEI